MIDHLPEIQLLLTGNEIMSGDTIDSNSAVIAQQLGEAGMGIHRKVTLGDDAQLIADELVDMAKSADVVIVNGGLGPTIDDLTLKYSPRPLEWRSKNDRRRSLICNNGVPDATCSSTKPI